MENTQSVEGKEEQEGAPASTYSLATLVIVAVVSFATGALAFWSVGGMQGGPDDAEACFYELLKNGMPGGSAMAICDNMFPSALNLPHFPTIPPDAENAPTPESATAPETPPPAN